MSVITAINTASHNYLKRERRLLYQSRVSTTLQCQSYRLFALCELESVNAALH